MGFFGGNSEPSCRQDGPGLKRMNFARFIGILHNDLDETGAVAQDHEVEFPKGADGVEPSADKYLFPNVLRKLFRQCPIHEVLN